MIIFILMIIRSSIEDLMLFISLYSLISYIILYLMLIIDDLMHSFVGSIIFCIELGLFFMIIIVGILLFGLRLVRFFWGGLLGLCGGRIFGG